MLQGEGFSSVVAWHQREAEKHQWQRQCEECGDPGVLADFLILLCQLDIS